MSDEGHEDTGHYDGTPGAKKEGAITVFNQFESELQQRANSIFSMLPSNVSPEKFRNTAIAAVKKNPDLLKCTPRTLFAAITAAALDGLMPDGKEGIIQDRNTKVSRKGQQDRWEVQATWQPMFHGFRKRARELDGLLVDAQVVYKNDLFKRIQGDEPKLIHEPAAPDQDTGPLVACYAIFKREDGTILHREVMRASEIQTTREKSKQPDGMMWKDFTGEAWKKTVGRRGFKSVPCSEHMSAILDRDDRENFEFDQTRTEAAVLVPPSPPTPPPPPAITKQDTVVLPTEQPNEPVLANKPRQRKKGENRGEPPPAEAPKVEDGPPEAPPPEGTVPVEPPAKESQEFVDFRDDYLPLMLDELKTAKDANDTNLIHETFNDNIQGALEKGRISRLEYDWLKEKWEKDTA